MCSRSKTCQIAFAAAISLLVLAPPLAHAQAPVSAQMQQGMQRQEAQQRFPRAERADMMVRAEASEDRRSLSDAVRRVQRSTGGHILGVETVPFDGRDINRVKYMDERGRVRYMDDPVQQRSQPRPPRSDMSSLRGDNP